MSNTKESIEQQKIEDEAAKYAKGNGWHNSKPGNTGRSWCESDFIAGAKFMRSELKNEIEQLQKENRELREALEKSVDIIKAWHNMGERNTPERLQDEIWRIYYEHSPEMKPVRTALSNNSEDNIEKE